MTLSQFPGGRQVLVPVLRIPRLGFDVDIQNPFDVVLRRAGQPTPALKINDETHKSKIAEQLCGPSAKALQLLKFCYRLILSQV